MTQIFLDGADLKEIEKFNSNPRIEGFTTNPTLMRKAGVVDYVSFASEAARLVYPKPISFEVFSDDFSEMERQAIRLSQFGSNVYVKIPITDSKGNSTREVITELSSKRIGLNITAITTYEQVYSTVNALASRGHFISVFAGRIADTGVDPLPLMQSCVELLDVSKKAKLIWASPRELLNLVQARQIGCHVITVTKDILQKLDLLGKDLTEYSLETVKMFRNDAIQSGFEL